MVEPSQFEFGDFHLDASERALYRQGQLVPITPKALETLLFLVERRGHIVDKDELMKAIWPDTFVEEVSLARNISVIRKLLSDGEDGRAFIETIPKRGYRFVAEVRFPVPLAVAVDGFVASTADGTVPKAIHRRKSVRLRVLAAGAVVLALFVVVLLNIAGLQDRLYDYLLAPKIQSLAVLPLENVSGDASQDFFADGMTDALITDLAKIHSLRVISRTSTVQYKGTRKPLPQIARELGIDAIVEGTVLRSGNQVRVNAQLIRAQHESHLWADMYQRDIGDSISLQGEIAQAIAGHVRAQLTSAERAELSAVRRVNPKAYELYLQGRYYWNKRDPSGLGKALVLFQEAIDNDPDFALGYAGLADTYNVMVDSVVIPPTEAFSKSRTAALKALQLDGYLAEAHASLAQVLFLLDWDWPAADREFRRASELNPNYATARQWYASYLAAMGRCEESRAEIHRAELLDPLSLIIRLDEAAVVYWCRNLDLAVDQVRNVIEMAPDYPQARFYIAGAYVDQGKYDQGLAEFKKGRALAGGTVVSERVFEAWTEAKRGNRTAARRILDELPKTPTESGWDNFVLASAYGNLGDFDSAFQYLEQAYRIRSYWLVYLNAEPRFDPLRGDPRFKDLLQRMHLN